MPYRATPGERAGNRISAEGSRPPRSFPQGAVPLPTYTVSPLEEKHRAGVRSGPEGRGWINRGRDHRPGTSSAAATVDCAGKGDKGLVWGLDRDRSLFDRVPSPFRRWRNGSLAHAGRFASSRLRRDRPTGDARCPYFALSKYLKKSPLVPSSKTVSSSIVDS